MDRIEKILVFVVVATIVVIVTLALSNTGDDAMNDEGGDPTGSIADDSTRAVSNDGTGETPGRDVDLSPPTVIPSDVIPSSAGNPPNPAVARGSGTPGSDPVDATRDDVGGDDAVHTDNLPGPTPAPAAQPALAKQTYVVKPNDSLWKISKQFYGDGKYWRRLQEANTDRVGADGAVKPNTTLVVPQINRAAAAKKPVHIVVPNDSYRIVTLRKGEWLYQVLRRENMTSRKKDVLKLNGLTETEARDLKPGFKLKLPHR